jgi:hypothetical protein
MPKETSDSVGEGVLFFQLFLDFGLRLCGLTISVAEIT